MLNELGRPLGLSGPFVALLLQARRAETKQRGRGRAVELARAGLSNDEIARKLRIHPVTVSRQITRALGRSRARDAAKEAKAAARLSAALQRRFSFQLLEDVPPPLSAAPAEPKSAREYFALSRRSARYAVRLARLNSLSPEEAIAIAERVYQHPASAITLWFDDFRARFVKRCRRLRDRRIIGLAHEGKAPAAIARIVGLSATRTGEIIRNALGPEWQRDVWRKQLRRLKARSIAGAALPQRTRSTVERARVSEAARKPPIGLEQSRSAARSGRAPSSSDQARR